MWKMKDCVCCQIKYVWIIINTLELVIEKEIMT